MFAKYGGLIFFSYFIYTGVFASEYSIKFSIERQSYAMSNLRDLQQSVAMAFQQEGINLQPVQQFPARFTWSVSLLKNLSKFGKIGLFYGYASSGGRLHYADRSGELAIDQVVSNHSIGINLELSVVENRTILSFYTKPTIYQSILDHRETINIFDDSAQFFVNQSSESKARELSMLQFGLESGFLVRLPVKSVFAELHIGYFISRMTYFQSKSVNPILLNNESLFRSLDLDWSGLRVGISLGI